MIDWTPVSERLPHAAYMAEYPDLFRSARLLVWDASAPESEEWVKAYYWSDGTWSTVEGDLGIYGVTHWTYVNAPTGEAGE